MSKRIKIEIVGSASDAEDVRLGDMIEQLQAVRRALKENDLFLSGGSEPTLEYKVVDLRHSSPATVIIEPVPLRDMSLEYPDEVTHGFSTELRLIKRDAKLLHEPELPRLDAYDSIGSAAHNLVQKVRITVDRKVVTIDDKFKRNVEMLKGPDELSEGSVSGTLEALNFHNTNKFTLYPMLGARKLNGTFDATLRPKVKDAIGNFVTVFGRLRFKAWSQFPHGVMARDIDMHERDNELPTLTELRGTFAGMTGNMSSVAFIRRIRNEDWQ